jgi:hypothetical protein
MAEKPPTPIPENDELLTTLSVKVPRWVEDEILQICRDTGLDLSKATRIALIEVAKIFQKHWKKGPALGPFLEHLEFKPEQYNLFFEPRKGK